MCFDPNRIDPFDPRYALFRYHLLFDQRRSSASLHSLSVGSDWAVLLIAHNATDPEAPLVIAHGTVSRLVRQLLSEALCPGQRYLFIVPYALRPMLLGESRAAEYSLRCLLYSCSRLLTKRDGANLLRFPTEQGCYGFRRLLDRRTVSEARVNWQTDRFAEIGVHTKRDFRGRGFAKDALYALTVEILQAGLCPLYVVGQKNLASLAVCQSLGYEDSGLLEYETVARYAPSAGRLLKKKGDNL